MSDTTSSPPFPPGQGGTPPGLDPNFVPPGFTRVPFELLRRLNVPASDPKSLLKRRGSAVSVDGPVQTDGRPPAEIAPPDDSYFEPGGGGQSAVVPPGRTGQADTSQESPTTLAAATTTAPTATVPGETAAAAAPATFAQAAAANAIVLENQKPGNPRSEWDLSGQASSNIEGFTTDISYNLGQRVDFKINTDSNNYRVDIYRLGYYGGSGARKVATLQHQAPATAQPAPLRQDSTGMVDAGNWSVTDSWQVPSDAVSGVYIAKLVRQDGTAGASHVPFILRNDASTSDIVFQTADETWQAYNGWGGANAYGGNGPGGGSAPGRAFAVSYNRPIGTRDGIGTYSGPQDYIFGAEFSGLRWLEQNGYDVSYISGVDASRNGALLRNHKAFISAGHDEYWTGAQRSNVEAARDAGVNLAFWSGNEVYWKTRLEPSPVDGTVNRTMVVHKETREGPIDPSEQWTGTWRDLTYSGANDGGRPENSLTGTLFQVDAYRADSIRIPFGQSRLRLWRDTSVANIAQGQTASLTNGYLGYEWDEAPDNGFRPNGLVKASSTTMSVGTYLMDFGTWTGSANATHNLTLYKAPSGAIVFGAGTVYWTWGLDANHDLTATPTDARVQQAMVNLFADMGVQPQTLQASLKIASQSTDATAPVSTISSPTSGTSVGAAQKVAITGSSSDVGGVVAGIEVSTDNGLSWHPATGSATSWTYTWRTPAPGTYTIRSRAVDDSLNIESPSAGRTVTVTPSASVNLFQNDTPAILSNPDSAVQLGVKFTSSQPGTATGVRFYKGSNNTGTHVGSLWTATGTRLASATFTNETATGWQQVNFASPVAITAGQTYVAAYHAPNGGYSTTPNYFMTPVQSGPLTAPATKASSPNGVYAYGPSTGFPDQGIPAATNYWVDVVFRPSGTAPAAGVVTSESGGSTAVTEGGAGDSFTVALASQPTANVTVTASGDADLLVTSGGAAGAVLTFTPQNWSTAQTISVSAVDDSFVEATETARVNFATSSSDAAYNNLPVPALNVAVTDNDSPSGTVSLFSATDVPANPSVNDPNAVELGVKFTASQPGTVTGIRFYKGSGNTGTHVGSLWNATGTRLRQASFTNETASGWQQVNFSTPVSITAGQTYIASYHAPNGNYAANGNYFGTSHTSGPLTAPSSASSGGNGVYRYGAAGSFPNQTFNATNYWVGVVFSPSGTAPAAGVVTSESGGSTAVTEGGAGDSFTVALASQPTANVTVTASGDADLLVTSGGAAGAVLTFTPQNWSTAQTISVSAVDDSFVEATETARVNFATSSSDAAYNNLPMPALNVAVTDNDSPSGTVSLFSATDVPANPSVNDPNAVELGVKFTASQPGTVTGIRFYKGSGNTGTHVGSLWNATGTRLRQASFTNETASGWQQVNFSTPVSITAGQTYIASYHAPNGNYAANGNYFGTSHTSGPLTAPSSASSGGNGVYRYGAAGSFPNQTFNATNYWVDVVFQPQLAA